MNLGEYRPTSSTVLTINKHTVESRAHSFFRTVRRLQAKKVNGPINKKERDRIDDKMRRETDD